MTLRLFIPLYVLILTGLSASAAGKPNILYILADDLGFSDLGCFGGEIKTPVLDSLAAGGVRLTQFYNTGRCCPSPALRSSPASIHTASGSAT